MSLVWRVGERYYATEPPVEDAIISCCDSLGELKAEGDIVVGSVKEELTTDAHMKGANTC
jgi:hypothetical protein